MSTRTDERPDASAAPAAAPRRAKTKVVFVLAWGRSGSTILDNALGEIEHFFSAGEVRFLWARGITKGWRCGCGRLVVECPVWSRVLAALGPAGLPELRADALRIEDLQERLTRVRQTRLLLASGRGDSDELDRYLDVLERLFSATSEVTGAHVVIDSSKRPSDAAVLELVDAVELYVVHLVRDPRAVAYSWSKRHARVGRHGVVRSTLNWVGWNLASESVVRCLGDRGMFLRYEDFVRAPRATLERIVALVGEDPSSLPPLEGNRLELSVNHTVSGNPSRFRTGAIEIRPEDGWVDKVGALKWWTATLLALPRLRRYGYGLRRARRDLRAPR